MSNLQIILKPCQSGKTFTKLTEIKRLISIDEAESRSIHIIFTDNSILQTIQLKERITPFLESGDEGYIEKKKFVVVTLSSKSRKCSKPEALLPFLKKDKTKIIISCANSIRFNDIDILVKSLNSFNFFIWIDEADKSVSNQFSIMINEWLTFDNVRKMTFITATPEPLLKVYGDIKLVPINEAYDRELYHRFVDSDIRIVELEKIKKTDDETESVVSSKAVQYAHQILIKEEVIENNSKWFIPANHRMDTHDEMAFMLLKDFGFSVVVVNGNGKFLHLPFTDEIINIDMLIDTNCEVSKWLAQVYIDYIPSSTPFALTGKLCLGRGITISSPELIFTHSIFPPVLAGRSSNYQLAGRMSGNMKKWEGYQKPIIYCTSKFYDCIVLMEEASIKLTESSSVATLESYIEARGGNKKMNTQKDPIIKKIKVYDMTPDMWETDIKGFIRNYYPTAKPQSAKVFLKSKRYENGFLYDFFRGKSSEKIYKVDEIMTNKSAGLGKKNRYRINIAYSDLDDPFSGYFIVRVLPPPEES